MTIRLQGPVHHSGVAYVDFANLFGGSFEAYTFDHERESTTKREANLSSLLR
jgi:hypothetical protein